MVRSTHSTPCFLAVFVFACRVCWLLCDAGHFYSLLHQSPYARFFRCRQKSRSPISSSANVLLFPPEPRGLPRATACVSRIYKTTTRQWRTSRIRNVHLSTRSARAYCVQRVGIAALSMTHQIYPFANQSRPLMVLCGRVVSWRAQQPCSITSHLSPPFAGAPLPICHANISVCTQFVAEHICMLPRCESGRPCLVIALHVFGKRHHGRL